ncbi:MAG: hypothetical protein PHW13_04840 [Methylococcales bacterium]|nr:hypothetical protein [Methylococcales bacterium]
MSASFLLISSRIRYAFSLQIMESEVIKLVSDRNNIVVIADEAHRTQYGFEAKLKAVKSATVKAAPTAANYEWALQKVVADKPPPAYQNAFQVGYAQHLRDALPNVTFVAFTGTPVSLEDRDTRSVFGEHSRLRPLTPVGRQRCACGMALS